MDKLSEHHAQLLGLGDSWLVDDVDLDLANQKVVIQLSRNPDAPVCCPECEQERPLKDHAAKREWRHLDTMQFETVLAARTPRTKRPDCGVLNVKVPWAEPHSRFTLFFEAFAIRVLQAASSIEQGRQLLGLCWSSANDIMTQAVERGLKRRDLDKVTDVGAAALLTTFDDEKSFGKGQDYVSIMTDIQGKRVLEVVPERTKDAADSLWKTLSDEQKEQIQAVSMDMWQAFMSSAAENVPNAKIVHDRFHIVKYLNEAVDKVRRAENKALQAEDDERLKGSRYLWLTSEENQSDEQSARFESLKTAQLKTARAWAIRELFEEFYDQAGESGGREFVKDWYSWAVRCRLQPVVKVAQMIKRHLDRIVTWFEHPISNGPAEGFNSRIQSIKAAARGFRKFANYRTRILFFCGKLDMRPAMRQ